MSNFLAVDTSSKYLTVVAVKGEKQVINYIPDCAMRHSVMLMSEVDRAMTEAGLSPDECDFFGAVTGPGSFTGIRIGISCVKGFSVATGKKCVGVTAFDLIAYNVNSATPYLVAIDAAHEHFYLSGYVGGKCNLQPCYLSREQVINFGLPVYGFEDLDLPNYTKVAVQDCLIPAICGCAKEGVAALYVRKSQAEEERIARLGGAK